MELFINPALLLGAALAAAPVILHLIMRQQPRRLPFPALQFLRVRQHQNTRRLQLRHLLLLLLRVLVVCIMACGLARPRLNSGGGMWADQEAPVAAVMAIDTSSRMDYQQQNQSRLEAAKEMAAEIVASLPDDSEVALVDSRVGSTLFQLDLNGVADRIGRLDTTPVGQPLSVMLDASLEALSENAKERRELYLFTDLAASSWNPPDLQAFRDRLNKTPGVSVYIVDVGANDPQNTSLGDLKLTHQAVPKNAPNMIRLDMQRVGAPAEATAELWLLSPEREPEKRAETTVKIAAGESPALEFPLPYLEEGVHQGYVELAGARDGLPIDDRRYFTVEVLPARKVLLVAASIEQAAFLEEALAPEKLKRQGRARYECRVIGFGDLLQTALAEEFSVVCLIDPPPLTAATWSQLHEFAAQGGGVGVFLGRAAAADPAGYATEEAQKLLPGKLLQVGRRVQGDAYLAPDYLSHAMLQPLLPYEEKIPWKFYPVYRWWQIEASAPDAAVVIRLTNQQPILFERRIGKGRVLTMLTPVSDWRPGEAAWNDLVLDWPFAILADSLCSYLTGSLERSLNYSVGRPAVLALPPGLPRTNFSVGAPNGDASQQVSDPTVPQLVLARTDQVGNYRVIGAAEPPVDLGFSTNLPAALTRLDRLSKEQIDGLKKDLPVVIATSREELAQEQQYGRVGRELFPFLMALLAILMTLEMFVSSRFYRERLAG
ncbi:MAG TPA: VWA domain-containing protein [Pirellulales bacterium]